MISLNLSDFSSNIQNTKGLDSDEILVRELYQFCSTPDEVSLDDLKNIKAKHLLVIYNELHKENVEDMKILNDLVVTEYAKENLKSSSIVEDDDEIY